MDAVLSVFKSAYLSGNGVQVAHTILPITSTEQPIRLQDIARSSSPENITNEVRYSLLYDNSSHLKLSTEEGRAWVEVFVAYWKTISLLVKAEKSVTPNSSNYLPAVYNAWKELSNIFIRGYGNGSFEAWTIPCLYVSGRYLRIFAINADESLSNIGSESGGFQDDFNPETGKNEKLEDAARVLNRMFQLCISDRAPLEESRKFGIYYIVNLLFKTYFKLNSITLSKNIIRALQASQADMPGLDTFPKSHQVTYKYYMGVIYFLEEDYVKAEDNLTQAWRLCHKAAKRNHELILTYLIPCHLLTTHTLPSRSLLEPYPRLQALFLPLSQCVKRGDLAGFDAALVAGEDEFVKRRIYLTLERGRDIALRNLLRKVFIVGGFEGSKDGGDALLRRTRVPVAEFGAAISIGSKERIENDEVECLLANIIYKNLMKGYIARERGIVVLSKAGAFPGTGV